MHLTSNQVRNKFTEFFKKYNHEKIASSSIIPHNDKTLLFCNAGMNQFKDYFTGKSVALNKRATSIQKCVRAGGKHNDLDNVGHTSRHHTFFEMLGNFSFGDYFKKEAISFAWEFLTKELQIPKERLYVTVHYSDDEAKKIWHEEIGVSLDRIFTKGDKDNFWEMGEFGPCGPCSEIFYDHGEKYTDRDLVRKDPNDLLEDEKRYVEIWNLVFMQFEKTPEGKFNLPKPSIDTGAGLERLMAAIQNCYNNYNTDIFLPTMNAIEKLSGKKYLTESGDDLEHSINFRVVADHIRSSTMLITDGIIPSNEGRGYVLRRIIRRAIKYLNELGVKEIAFYKLVPVVFETLGEEYPQNKSNMELATKLIELEERKFRETLENGLKELNSIFQNSNNKILSGDLAFKLYDTYGFPLDLTEMYCADKKFTVDLEGFEKCMLAQKELSKKSWKGGIDNSDKIFHEIKEKFGPTEFKGYELLKIEAKLLEAKSIGDQRILIFDKTPFYGESGGQTGDIGTILKNNNILANISNTIKPVDGLHVHISSDADALEVGETYTLLVETIDRKLTMRNHSATHLLQSALIKILGSHVKQAGSLVSSEKLRFDFTHLQAVTKNELQLVEDLVNEMIKKNLSVNVLNMTIDEAHKLGAMALFGEKYGTHVRVLKMGDFSTELCGGTHVENTSDIGLFTILSETSLATGVRRIEATTSDNALNILRNKSKVLKNIENLIGEKEEKLLEKIQALTNDLKNNYKENEMLKDKIQTLEAKDLFSNLKTIKNFPIGIIETNKDHDIRKLSDLFVSKFQDGIAILYNTNGQILVRLGKNQNAIKANEVLKEILLEVEGKGGGKPDLAQGSFDLKYFSQLSTKCETILTKKLI